MGAYSTHTSQHVLGSCIVTFDVTYPQQTFEDWKMKRLELDS